MILGCYWAATGLILGCYCTVMRALTVKETLGAVKTGGFQHQWIRGTVLAPLLAPPAAAG
eukprot:1188516-Prorocentrum_minimum.AAC.2